MYYDKSKAELLNYVKAKEDEIKELNIRVKVLEETVEFNTVNIQQVSEKVYWGSGGVERDIENLETDNARMKRKLEFNTGLTVVQPILWGICWALISWLMK